MEDSREAEVGASEAAGQVLLSGLVDWVSLDEVITYVRHDLPAAEAPAIREATLGVVERLLSAGLVEVGELRPEFVSWALDTSTSLDAIRRAWHDPYQRFQLGEVCWLANTTAGDSVAERLTTNPA